MFFVSALLALCVLVFGPRAASSSLPYALACNRGYVPAVTHPGAMGIAFLPENHLPLFRACKFLHYLLCRQGLLLNATCADCTPGYFCAAGSLNTFGGGVILPAAGAISGHNQFCAWQMPHNCSTVRRAQNMCNKSHPQLAGQNPNLMMVTSLFKPMRNPHSVALDGSGFVYWTSSFGNHIMRASLSTGAMTLVAGLGNFSFADGSGTNAAFNKPTGAAFDSNGSLFVADTFNHRIRQVNVSSGVVTTLAGNGTAAFSDGTGTMASFYEPRGVVADSSGNLFVADSGNNRIRRILIATGVVTTLAGNAQSGSGNGVGTQATFSTPFGITLDSTGNVFVTESFSGFVRQIVIASGAVSLLAGGGNFDSFPDGIGSNAVFNTPVGLACDSNGNLVLAQQSACVRQIVIATSRVSTLAGGLVTSAASYDGIGTSAAFRFLQGLAVDGRGNIFLTDSASGIRVAQTTTPCFPGYYCPGGAAIPWQAGSFSANAGLSAPVGGGACSASYYCPSGSSSATQVACAQGTYCPTTGLSAAVPCPAGSFCADPALQAVSGPCQAGFYCPSRSISATAVPCASGDYCAAGASARTRCPATFYCENPDVKVACPLGTFCPAGSSAFSVSCPAGCVCGGGGADAAVQCSVGSYCVNGAALPCPAGSVCPLAGMSAALPCPSGRFCSTTGLSAPAGNCNIGQVCPPGADAPRACPLGFLCAVPGLAAPQSCPSGSACSATAIITQQCAPGTYAVGNASACTPCPSGTFNNAAGIMQAASLCAFFGNPPFAIV
jgi:hypothetical protein